jgi:hypothetical protein
MTRILWNSRHQSLLKPDIALAHYPLTFLIASPDKKSSAFPSFLGLDWKTDRLKLVLLRKAAGPAPVEPAPHGE